MMGYTEEAIRKKLEEASANANTLYREDFINYLGIVSGGEDTYTELIAGELLSHLNWLDEEAFSTICRKSTYNIPRPETEEINPDSNREEEHIAKKMKGNTYSEIGVVLNYQVPLRNIKEDAAGKIDLISRSGDTLYIIELKRKDSRETLLRAVLEIYTYSKVANRCKLKEDFNAVGTTVVPAVLVFKDGVAHKQYRSDCPKVRELMDKLGVKLFVMTGTLASGFTVHKPE